MSDLRCKALLYFSLLLLGTSHFAPALTIDWSGFSRVDLYSMKWGEDALQNQGALHLVVKPRFQIIDQLDVVVRADLNSLSLQKDIVQGLKNNTQLSSQLGYIFYNSNTPTEDVNGLKHLFLNISQLYIDYQTDFLKFRIGRAPYHFGSGLTYSAERSPFDYWISSFYQMSVYVEYSQFYFQPAVLLLSGKDNFAGIVQAGLEANKWKVELLYHHGFSLAEANESSTNSIAEQFLEAIGYYQLGDIQNSLSVKYSFKDSKDIGVAYEGSMNLPVKMSPNLGVKAGYVSESTSFNPNYRVASVLFHLLEPKESEYNLLPSKSLNDVVYFSPSLKLDFNKNFNVMPVVSTFYQLSNSSLHYELDLKAEYLLEEKFSVSMVGSLLKSNDTVNYGLTARAVVTF